MGGNFRNHCETAENFADFKRVSSGLSNGTRMRITRPAGRPAAFIKAEDLRSGTRSAKFRTPTNSTALFAGATERGWRKEKRDDGAQNAKRLEDRTKEKRENEKEWQLNAISRESNGSRA